MIKYSIILLLIISIVLPNTNTNFQKIIINEIGFNRFSCEDGKKIFFIWDLKKQLFSTDNKEVKK